jgi:hypothetical protein
MRGEAGSALAYAVDAAKTKDAVVLCLAAEHPTLPYRALYLYDFNQDTYEESKSAL